MSERQGVVYTGRVSCIKTQKGVVYYVAIPKRLAKRLKLQRGQPVTVFIAPA